MSEINNKYKEFIKPIFKDIINNPYMFRRYYKYLPFKLFAKLNYNKFSRYIRANYIDKSPYDNRIMLVDHYETMTWHEMMTKILLSFYIYAKSGKDEWYLL